MASFPIKIMTALSMTIATQLAAGSARAADPLSGTMLYADVERYAAFGIHRFGTPADRATTDWIAQELTAAGFKTEFQTFSLGKQYYPDKASVGIDGVAIDALPFWWPPEDKASFALKAPFAADGGGDAAGKVVWLKLPNDRTAYLAAPHKQAIATAAARHPAAILLTIDNPGEEIFVYNVTQDDPSWPAPVIVIGSRHKAQLEAAQRAGTLLDIAFTGKFEKNVEGRNVVARLDRGLAKTIVVSTPMTGWFTCACERGSGIAAFLAMARTIAAARPTVNIVFVATAGHEIGHGGMEIFLHRDPPKPESTLGWIHVGASVACYEWRKDGDRWVTDKVVDGGRRLISSPSTARLTDDAFAGQTFNRVVSTTEAPPGELREVKAAGYPNFLGIASGHRFFHNPSDTPATTGPEALEPVARALSRALEALAATNDAKSAQTK